MGDLDVRIAGGKKLQNYTKSLLTDIRALELMLERGMFDINTTRIGAEQELCLLQQNWKPAYINLELLDALNDEDYTSELAKFNIEINFTPLVLEGKCLSQLEKTILQKINKLRQAALSHNAEVIFTGILPSVRKYDLKLENLTPLDRYKALMTALKRLRGEDYELKISGIDELNVKHDTALLEACNTGFQVHIQVNPDKFATKYNIAQAVAGPTLAAAVNSPLLFGKRLWQETRIALFQQSVDTRKSSSHLREHSPRVTFGNKWLKDSILEIYKEDAVRFRIILGSESNEDALKMLEEGKTPSLKGLTVHNSTVYRWNRPCYGIKDGIAHLRIENRVLPAGPTVIDEMANAALWLGIMHGMDDEYPDISKVMNFDDARNNFFKAARHGLDSTFNWVNGKSYQAKDLILNELVPIAKKGLEKANLDKNDIDRYLGVIQARVESGKTGSSWLLKSHENLSSNSTKDETAASLTAATVQKQKKGEPVHTWEPLKENELPYWEPTSILVEEFMTRDLFTVQKDDIIELAMDFMDWEKIRFLPVEDKKGNLVGLVTSRILLRYLRHNEGKEVIKQTLVKDIMIQNPKFISPYDNILKAIHIMESNQIGCLPVVKDSKLVGIVTEQDSLTLSSRLFKRLAKNK